MISIGKRWAGKEIPPALPPALADFVSQINNQNDDGNNGSWTLTFLEGKPVVYHSAGAEATIDESGNLVLLADQ